jgi:hypothetical protein
MATEPQADRQAMAGAPVGARARRPGTVTAVGWLLHLQAAVGVLAIIALNALLGAVGGVDGRVVRIATGMGVALVVLIVLGLLLSASARRHFRAG